MTYAKMLNKIIADSELSLRQIAKRCKDLNLSITPSYISQLKNGKLPPPTEEVSLVLSKACESNLQAELVFLGYMEKAPSLVKEYMLASSTVNKALLSSLCKASGQDFTKEMDAYIRDLDVLAALNMSSDFISMDNPEGSADLVKEIMLSAGMPTEADTKGNVINFFQADNSMQPLIPAHALIYAMPTRTDLLKDRDIIAFYPSSYNIAALRRTFFTKDQVLLIPEDKNHEIYTANDMESIRYIGKVVSFKVDL